MTVGSPGGATILASVAQVLLNVIHYDMDLKDAIEEPRIYSNKYPSIRWEKRNSRRNSFTARTNGP